MKNTNILSLSWFLLLAIFLAIHCPWPSSAEGEDCDRYLCDDAWEYVKAGEPYYFGSPLKTQGGEISLENTNPSNEVTCPRQAVVLKGESNGGGTFIFKPIVPDEKGRVPLATALAISYGEELKCEEETGVLQMTRRSKELSFWHMTADGTANTAASCFQILKHTKPSDPENKESYFMQNCPYLCGQGTIGYCQNVGNVSTGLNNTNTNLKYYLTATTKQPFEFSIRGDWGTDQDASIRIRST